MYIFYNKYIPVRGFSAINLFGVVLARKEYKPLSAGDINHERIHTAQLKETGFIIFYLWYILEWTIRSIIYWNPGKAYYSMAFEKEAYENENNMDYSAQRKFWNFLQYYRKAK